MPAPRLRPAVVAARAKLAEGREKARAQHQSGSPGIQVCAHLTDLLDTVIVELYESALADGPPGSDQLLALVPNGGYGRRDVAPYSDVDLMILIQPNCEERLAPVIRQFQNSIFDAGLQMGPSVRTPAQACAQALADATVFTSLAEARYLAGNPELFQQFWHRFRRKVLRRSNALIDKIEVARRNERRQFGETVYLLEPNVKRSRGGLRDLQLLRWVGYARYGEADPESLQRSGILTREDRRRLRAAREFLLQLRNELHFHAGKSQDVLRKDEQLRLARQHGYASHHGLLPVEHFMRNYIEHTSEVRYIVTHFVDLARPRRSLARVIDPLFSHSVGGDFRVGPLHIAATRRGLAKVRHDLAETLRLMDLSNQYNVRIDRPTWQAVREAMSDRDDIEVSPAAAERFLSLLSQPAQLGDLLRRLHELRVLERLVPSMAHARCLMQFNDYHKYTVDEHSIRAVECATEFMADRGAVGEAYRAIRDKRLLHLALLLHDLGKGYPEDHSEVGSRLAQQTGRQLGLGESETETLRLLVHRHLLLSHLAQRRDIHDDAVVVQLAVEVGSADVLQMLYVLTCADLAAVGPGVLSSWKLDLITQLYHRTRERLAGDRQGLAGDHWLLEQKQLLRQHTAGREDAPWWERMITALPRNFFVVADSPQAILGELETLRTLPRDQVAAWGRFRPQQNAVEYSVAAHEEIVPGIFHRLTGALSSQGMQILSAEIHTLPHNLVLDRFYVLDTDYGGPPPEERLQEVTTALRQALLNRDSQPIFRKTWPVRGGSCAIPDAAAQPARVKIDLNTSESFTIIDIFAHDRRGLLYAIARTLFELQLSVHVAKIGTYLDQVVDVFYVTDLDNRKVTAPARLHEIRQRLLDAIDQHPTQGD